MPCPQDLFVPVLFASSVLASICPAVSAGAGIRITSLELDRKEITCGDSFVLRVAAVGHGVDVLSYRIRTPYEVGKGELPPGFYLEQGRAVYRADKGAIFDNRSFDLDPADGAVAVKISTQNLSEGTHYLVVFAHNRPGPGAHVLDYRNVRLDVTRAKVRISVVGEKQHDVSHDAVQFELPSQTLTAGSPMICGARLANGQAGELALRLRPPYTWGQAEVLPGFTYDADAKVGYVEDGPDHTVLDNGHLDRDSARGRIRIEVPTDDWPSGVHFLTLEVPTLHTQRVPYGGVGNVYRDFVVRIPDRRDKLTVQVGPSIHLAEGTHFATLLPLGRGKVLADGRHLSEDGGRTWRSLDKGVPNANRLADGTIVGMTYKALPVKGQKGVYTGELHGSKDGALTVAGPTPSRVLVPKARPALGHGRHVGPLFGRSIVELTGGDLIAGMYGWFDGDTEPDRYRKGGTMRRAYVGRSADRGRTWEYLSTVAYRPFLGNEGYSELVIRKLPNGEILALVRTGGNSNPGWQDNPLMTSRSSDGGKTWTPVVRTGVEGVWPDLCVMHDGTLVCSTGRPGAFVMFSTDNGRTWADVTPIDAERYSGYTVVCEIEPGELLVGYSAKNWLDPNTHQRSNQLRLVRIKVQRPKQDAGGPP